MRNYPDNRRVSGGKQITSSNTGLVYLILSLLCITFGIGIYLFFRGSTLLVYNWIPSLLTLQKLFSVNPSSIQNVHPAIVYNLPDALWILSGIFFIRSLWLKNKKTMQVYIYVFCTVAIILEMLQLSRDIPGTFDFFDLCIFLFIPLIEGIIYTKVYRRRK